MSPTKERKEGITRVPVQELSRIAAEFSDEGAEVKAVLDSDGTYRIEARFIEGSPRIDPTDASRIFAE